MMYVHQTKLEVGAFAPGSGSRKCLFFLFFHQKMAMNLNCFAKYYRCSGQSGIEVRCHTESLAKFDDINRLSKYADKNGVSVMQLNLFYTNLSNQI